MLVWSGHRGWCCEVQVREWIKAGSDASGGFSELLASARSQFLGLGYTRCGVFLFIHSLTTSNPSGLGAESSVLKDSSFVPRQVATPTVAATVTLTPRMPWSVRWHRGCWGDRAVMMAVDPLASLHLLKSIN
jgi:hypothetical protein